MTIDIGPYRFTDHDATATLREADDFFAELVVNVSADLAAIAEPYRAAGLAAASLAATDESLKTLWNELRRCAEALRAAGAYGEPMTGRVVQLNTSGGGVPKLPVPNLDVGFAGAHGDVQATRRHHGRPWQALCIWSAEVIDDFAAAGHPLSYGSAGENITVTGLDWERVRPGVLIDIGTVEAEVTCYATPCKQNARWFIGGDFNAMHCRQGPVSRVYALVRRPGVVAVGDDVTVRSS